MMENPRRQLGFNRMAASQFGFRVRRRRGCGMRIDAVFGDDQLRHGRFAGLEETRAFDD